MTGENKKATPPAEEKSAEKKRPSIAELEAMLDRDEEVGLEILPNGEIRAKGTTKPDEIKPFKPLTMRENLGGEYSERAA